MRACTRCTRGGTSGGEPATCYACRIVPVDIHNESSGEDLVLSLFVDGARVATARADAEALDQLSTQLGRTRADVEVDLRSALEALHANELEKVTLDNLREHPPDGLSFVASYIYRDYREVTEGVVTYDVNKSVTGPEGVPALVRNKLRYAVHQRLVKGNRNAEELLKVFR